MEDENPILSEKVVDFFIPRREMAVLLKILLDELALALGAYRIFFIVKILRLWPGREQSPIFTRNGRWRQDRRLPCRAGISCQIPVCRAHRYT